MFSWGIEKQPLLGTSQDIDEITNSYRHPLDSFCFFNQRFKMDWNAGLNLHICWVISDLFVYRLSVIFLLKAKWKEVENDGKAWE